jgi:hypothetical protein
MSILQGLGFVFSLHCSFLKLYKFYPKSFYKLHPKVGKLVVSSISSGMSNSRKSFIYWYLFSATYSYTFPITSLILATTAASSVPRATKLVYVLIFVTNVDNRVFSESFTSNRFAKVTYTQFLSEMKSNTV